MATRCNITIHLPSRKEWVETERVCVLYKHRDWYPKWACQDIVLALKNKCSWDRDIMYYLYQYFEWDDLQITNDLHWDIEYYYEIYPWSMMHSGDKADIRIECFLSSGEKIATISMDMKRWEWDSRRHDISHIVYDKEFYEDFNRLD